MISVGTFCMGPLIEENVVIGKALMEGAGDAALYNANVSTSGSLGLMQLTLLLIVLIISVWKPWKKKISK